MGCGCESVHACMAVVAGTLLEGSTPCMAARSDLGVPLGPVLSGIDEWLCGLCSVSAFVVVAVVVFGCGYGGAGNSAVGGGGKRWHKCAHAGLGMVCRAWVYLYLLYVPTCR
jgi:hypothetical protein